MNEKIRFILEHISEDAKDIITFLQSVDTLEELRKNSLIKKGVIMSLLNIGELASRLPKEFIDEHSQIPWRSMIGMRNFAAHGYYILNLEIVWDTAQTSIPELVAYIEEIFEKETFM